MMRLRGQKKKRVGKQNRFFQRLMTVICIIVFCFSLYQLSVIFFDYYENRKVLADIQDVYIQKEEAVNIPNENRVDKIRDSFAPLLAMSDDIVGWITVDGTVIDYPILQANDNAFYLNRNYLGNETRAGSIFMDFRNHIETNGLHTILYGHKMKDGSMFTQLSQFLDQDFYNAHQTFAYDTLYESYEVEIFSAYVTTTDFYYIETEFEDKGEYAGFLKEISSRSAIHSNVSVSEEDQIITLSTCDYRLDRNKGRLVVHGKLLPRK